MGKIRYLEAGAVSLFAVVFSTLLLTVLVVGFMKLMVIDQQQALNNELSQSAYDAALAGVEDAKRVVRACQQGNALACRSLQQPHDCKVVQRSGVTGRANTDEVVIQSQSSGDGKEFNQAYTCANVTMDTEDFLTMIPEGRSRIIPLKSKSEFRTIVVEWFTKDDAGGSDTAGRLHNRYAAFRSLPPRDKWDEGASGGPVPSLMRAQIITPKQSFQLQDFDISNGTHAASSTLFLYPQTMAVAGPTNSSLVAAQPRAGSSLNQQLDHGLELVNCSKDFANSGYACRAEISVEPVSLAASTNAYIRLTPLYRLSHVKVTLKGEAAETVRFDGVQPAVDVTGRASNLFRRVEARLQIGDDFPYPENVADIENSLCKDFLVTDSTVTPGLCRP